MIAALFRRRREAMAARAAALRASADRFIRFNDDDLHTAFWRAHERMSDPDALASERRMWRDMVEEIDRRRPLPRPRADAATLASRPDEPRSVPRPDSDLP